MNTVSTKNIHYHPHRGKRMNTDQIFTTNAEKLATLEHTPNLVSFDEVYDNHMGMISRLREETDEILNGASNMQAAWELMLKITQNSLFQNIVHSEHHYASLVEGLKEYTSAQYTQIQTLVDSPASVSDEDATRIGDEYRQGINKLREAVEESKSLKKLADDYRNLAADLAHHISTLREHSLGVFEGETIGALKSLGEAKDGTLEWLTLRQQGFGASDMGALNDHESPWHGSAVSKIYNSKVKDITPEDVAAQLRSYGRSTDAISRGNNSEHFVAELYAAHNPEVEVLEVPQTYKYPGKPYIVNFDFMLRVPGDDQPAGNLEIKTSSNPLHWGVESDGLDGVPVKYRVQTLVQARTAGFTHGAIAVLINQYDFRVYTFTMDDKLAEEADGYLHAADEHWRVVEGMKSSHQVNTPGGSIVHKGFDKPTLDKPPVDNDITVGVRKRIALFKDVAALRGLGNNYSTVQEEFTTLMDGVEWNDTTVHQALTTLFAHTDVSNTTVVGVDVETGGYNAKIAPVIEAGLSIKKFYSPEEGFINKRYGITKRSHMAYDGTGAVDVHKITPEDLEGLDGLTGNEQAELELINMIRSADVLIAHNANYENMSLSQIPGYIEARLRGEIRVIDSMKLAKYLSSSPANTLQSSLEHEGGVYQDGHVAYSDATMCIDLVERIMVSISR